MNNIESIADELFNKIRSRFDNVTIGDENGKTIDDPQQAKFYNFDYKSRDGVKHGTITLNILDGKSLKATFSKGMALDFTPEQESEWQQFLRNLRQFARRNMLNFDIRDINRSSLTKRDVETTARQQSNYSSANSPVVESVQWHGTTRTSIQEFGATRLIVRHSEAVDESKPGARSRKIESMFVETAEGERFRMPYNKLSLGRAMAQHLAHGGKIYDEAGQHIQGIAEEMNNLAFFVRSTRHRQFEDTETTGMVESAIERYRGLKSNLGKLGKTRHYQEFAETFIPESNIEDDYDIDELKERFVKKMFDDRLTTALPYVYRAYQQRQVGEAKYVEQFSNWAEQVNEELGEADLEQLQTIMKEPIKAGRDGQDAIAAISSVTDNEELVDLISQAAQTQGEQADVRKIIDDWFVENYPEYQSMMPEIGSVVPNQDQNNPRATQAQNTDDVGDIRRLAGIR
jgi:hypothetical protein